VSQGGAPIAVTGHHDRMSDGTVATMAIFDAPWGPIHVAATERGVAAIELMTHTDAFVARLERRLRLPVRAFEGRDDRRSVGEWTRLALGALESYFAGRAVPDLVLDLDDRPAWDRAVLGAVREVGFGAVTSYGRIARRIGRPGAGQAVGGAVGRNPIGILIPCHRVIAGDGTLGGYGGAWWGSRERLLDVKRELLDLEGIRLPVRWTDDPIATTDGGPGASGRHR
jgi:methylated-DNA-[protein]-cysteine S-methyltransferase